MYHYTFQLINDAIEGVSLQVMMSHMIVVKSYQ